MMNLSAEAVPYAGSRDETKHPGNIESAIRTCLEAENRLQIE